MYRVLLFLMCILLGACGNPAQISITEFYIQFDRDATAHYCKQTKDPGCTEIMQLEGLFFSQEVRQSIVIRNDLQRANLANVFMSERLTELGANPFILEHVGVVFSDARIMQCKFQHIGASELKLLCDLAEMQDRPQQKAPVSHIQT